MKVSSLFLCSSFYFLFFRGLKKREPLWFPRNARWRLGNTGREESTMFIWISLVLVSTRLVVAGGRSFISLPESRCLSLRYVVADRKWMIGGFFLLFFLGVRVCTVDSRALASNIETSNCGSQSAPVHLRKSVWQASRVPIVLSRHFDATVAKQTVR